MKMTARQYAQELRRRTDVSRRRIVIALNKAGTSWLEEIKAEEPQKTGELVDNFRLRRASQDNLSVEIINPLPYADYAEDGHQQKKQWVPGVWEGNRFVYIPGAKTGMLVEEQWVPGNHVVRIAKTHAMAELRVRLNKILGD